MYSIASLVDLENENNWLDIEKSCNYVGIMPFNIPHFSWQTAEYYALNEVNQIINNFSKKIPPFEFNTSGLGIFNNDLKVIFLIVAKNRNLLDIHEQLWNELIPYAKEPNLHYAPDMWIPHISINIKNLDKTQFSCSIDNLLEQKLVFNLKVKEFGLLSLHESNARLESKFQLSGES